MTFHNPDSLPQQLQQLQQQLPQPRMASMATVPATDASSPEAAADAKSRRVRTSRPKVKTGCSSCKKRRIKCDEKRPQCSQCVKARKECVGYPPPARSTREIRIAPKPNPTALAPVGLLPAPRVAPVLQPRPALRPLQQLPSQPQPNLQLQPSPLQQTRQQHGDHHRQLQQHHRQLEQQRLELQRQGQQGQQSLQTAPRRAQKLALRRITPPQTPTAMPIPTLIYHPSNSLPFDQQDALYFQLFRHHTANELSGFFDNIFWSRTVLVECHSEAAIRYAVVALGALYRTLEKTTESPPGSPSPLTTSSSDSAFSHWEVALKQYSSACHALTGMSNLDERTQRTRLMASVLLACFDSFIGDHKQAIVQIQTGLALLERLRSEHRRAKPHHTTQEPVEDELTQMFTRLAIQAKSYDMAFHFPQPHVIRLLPQGLASTPESGDRSSPASPPTSSDAGSPVSTHQEAIPERFPSVREARLAWDSLCERILRFTEMMFQHANGPPNILPKSVARFGQQFRSHIEAWSTAFEPLLASRNNSAFTGQEKAGIAVLKMSQIMGQILFLMTFSDSEMQFDSFRPQFQSIVDLAFEVVGDEERRAAANRCPDPGQCSHHNHGQYGTSLNSGPSMGFDYQAKHIKASFSADLGIVPPLYVVATKSRDRLLRRQAIQLLRSSARREGMWDSELMARISMWVVNIEEEGEEEDFMEMMHRHSTGTLPSMASSGTTPGASPMSPASQLGRIPTGMVGSQPRSLSADFGEMPLGPGGNARWELRRDSRSPPPFDLQSATLQSFMTNQNLLHFMQSHRPVPSEKRVLVKACEFNLREHTATLQCGTRGLVAGAPDLKTRVTQIRW